MKRRVDRQLRYNPAIARRGDANPAYLTYGHLASPAALAARSTAIRAQRDPKRIGRGNFGIVYRVNDYRDGDYTHPSFSTVVKYPADADIHDRPWSRSAQRANLLHEAGVANELAALGYSVVPHIEYTELEDGTPVLVREYGEPVTSMTLAEYAELERELVAIEYDAGWEVHDELQLYRRPGGSLFVGDVGIWAAPRGHRTPRQRRMATYDSMLDHYLGAVIGMATTAPTSTLPGLQSRARVTAHYAGMGTRTGKGLKLLNEQAVMLANSIESRHAAGLPVPIMATKVLTGVRRVISRIKGHKP